MHLFAVDEDELIPGREKVARTSVSSLRPDGTGVSLGADGPRPEAAPALTVDDWLEFGAAFTY